jgi:GNAT superfamily N-acetyltransferase
VDEAPPDEPETSAPEDVAAQEEEAPPPPPTDEQVALAEEPGLWLPDEPNRMVFHGVGFSFVQHGRSAWVHRLRLPEDDDDHEVQRVMNHVDAILSISELAEATWWLGERTTPGYLADDLLELGLEPDDPAEMRSLTIARAPRGEPEVEVEVRRAATIEEMLQALEIDWETFGVADDERELRRSEARQAWPRYEADGTLSTYLAFVDGEPVGFARDVFTRHGVVMLGGATLPTARGKGVYTALVLARWAHAAERGAQRLVVSAGPQSAPILERLGFEPMGKVRLLRQKVT